MVDYKLRVGAGIATLLVLVAGAFALLRSPTAPLPLAPTGSFRIGGEYASLGVAGVRGTRYGSWSGSDANTGVLTSAPFVATNALVMTISGYPSHAGERLELVSVSNPKLRVLLATGEDPREFWQRRVVTVPSDWVGKKVTFVATDAGRGWADWIGVADVHSSGSLDVIAAQLNAAAANVRLQLILWTLFAFGVALSSLAAAQRLCRALQLPPLYLFSIVLIVLGVGAEITFFVTMFNTRVAAALVWIAALAGTVATFRALRTERFRPALTTPDAWHPFAVTLICALAYNALLSLGMPDSASVTGAMMTWLGMPSDNSIPHVLALHVAMHAPPKPFMGDWLSSDRPPLQAGFDLMFRAFYQEDGDGSTPYQAMSMLLQASIFGAMFTLCRNAGASALRTTGVIALALLSGFFFQNTAFVWPKLIAAAFLMTAMTLFAAGNQAAWRRWAPIGAATGLAWLSHGGVAFTIPALIAAWFIHSGRQAFRPLACAAICTLVLAIPWTCYQRYYDPPGDRLLKWHLAGYIPVTERHFLPLLIEGYAALPATAVFDNKLDNFASIAGIDTPARRFQNLSLRDREFYSVRFALGALVAPYLSALLFLRSRKRALRNAARYAWIALTTLGFWGIVMFGPGTTIVHQGSYLAMALLFVAAGCVATEWLPVFVVTACAQVMLFVSAWLPKFSPETFLTGGRWCDVVLLIMLAATAIALIWKPAVIAWKASGDGRQTASFISRAPELLTLVVVAIVFLVVADAAHQYLAVATPLHP